MIEDHAYPICIHEPCVKQPICFVSPLYNPEHMVSTCDEHMSSAMKGFGPFLVQALSLSPMDSKRKVAQYMIERI